MYVIKLGPANYICKGNYMIDGDCYQIVGTCDKAIKFKTEKSAVIFLNRIRAKRANLGGKYEVIELKEQK